jgi:GMP synthase (glutamine-hydrolysing)
VSDRPTVLVVDFGSQYSQLITRRLRELGVFSEMVPPWDAQARADEIAQLSGVILSGGPASVKEAEAPLLAPALLERQVPMLGICYGMQLLSDALGGSVGKGARREYGQEEISVEGDARLFAGTPRSQRVWMSHGDHVERAPEGFAVVARSAGGTVAAIADDTRGIYALQFHPEVSHTEFGMQMLENFVRKACGVEEAWNRGSFVEAQIAEIRERVGDRRVLCAVSGGVDSTVAATLVERAVGEQLTAVFVDNGLLRHEEGAQVRERLGELLHGHLVAVDASDLFLERLAGVMDPEEKRRVIGHSFIDVFEKTSHEHGPFEFLVQGTLYPDRIESLSVRGPSHVIKTHHNVGGLPERLGFDLIEPLAELFKDEVREVGKELQIPADMLNRHPFPGPGLAVRCLGEVTPERLALLRAADHIFIEELRLGGEYDRVWQAGAILLPVESVGVMGDQRTYQCPIALRAVTSRDAMTADWARLPDDLLARISNRIVREVDGINRVVYDISSKPPATIEWE